LQRRGTTENQEGWTYIEISIVMAVLIALAGIALPLVMSSVETSRIGKAIFEVNWLSTQISEYEKIYLQLPIALDEIAQGNHIDPWGTPYQYLDISKVKGKGKGQLRKNKSLVPLNTDFDLYSMGPDRKSKAPLTAAVSKDDIIRANDGRFIGKAEDY